MKKIFFFAILFLLNLKAISQEAGFESCSDAKIKSFSRFSKNLRQVNLLVIDDKIDINYYLINLKINYDSKQIKGFTTIGFKTLVDNYAEMQLDLKSTMIVDSVKIGNFILPFKQINEGIKITLDQQYAKNSLLKIRIVYHGSPESTSSFTQSFKFSKHSPAGNPLISTLSEPFGASDWFPCKNSLTDKADSSDVVITAATEFVTVSNGKLTSVKNNGDGTSTYSWQNRYPIAHYLISLAMSNYDKYENIFTAADGTKMPVEHYIYPESNTSTTRINLDQTVKMLGLYSEKFGPYPFLKEKYGHAQFDWGGGMEHQTCSSMVNFSGYLVAHELAHQWFGDKITCLNWENIWLNEGFATYSESIYAEFLGGKDGYTTHIMDKMTRAKLAKSSIFVKAATNENEIFNSNRTYSKGASVLHMLRGIVGDDVFFKILKTYIASKHGYSSATTEDFQAIVEQVSGQKFDYFFSQWIYGESYPKYSYNWQLVPKSTGGYEVIVDVSQQTNTTPAFFTMPIQFQIKTEKGNVQQTVMNDKATQRFTFDSAEKPTDVILDPNNLILKEASGQSQNVLSTEQGIENKLIVSPNPANDKIKVDFIMPLTGEAEFDLINISGTQIAVLLKEILTEGKQQKSIKLPKVPTGKYILRFKTGTKSQTNSIIIEN
jgi:aminopeptidase N